MAPGGHKAKAARRLVKKVNTVAGNLRKWQTDPNAFEVLDAKGAKLSTLRKRAAKKPPAKQRTALLAADKGAAACRAETLTFLEDAYDESNTDDLGTRLLKLCGRYSVPLVATALGETLELFAPRVAAANAFVDDAASAFTAYLAETGKDPAVAARRTKDRAYVAALRSGERERSHDRSAMALLNTLRTQTARKNARAKGAGRDQWSLTLLAHAARGTLHLPRPRAVVLHRGGYAVRHDCLRGLPQKVSWNLDEVAAYANECAERNKIPRREKSSDDDRCLRKPCGRQRGWGVDMRGHVPGVTGVRKHQCALLTGPDGKPLYFATRELAVAARDAFFKAEPKEKKKMVAKSRQIKAYWSK